MADVQIGPFLVKNANVAQLNDVRAVAARLPANMQGGTTVINFGPRPSGAPNWAQGYNQGANAFWVNGHNDSSTRQYVIAHEYWHAWSRTHSAQEAQAKQLLTGTFGNTETSTWSNDPDEGLADSFARALGFRAFPKYDWRVYVPTYQYSQFLTILGGSSTTPPPPTTTPPTGGLAGDPFGFSEGIGNLTQGFRASIEHGFFFLVILLIGLVLLIVGFKAKAPSGGSA